jgi:hypothetical protein
MFSRFHQPRRKAATGPGAVVLYYNGIRFSMRLAIVQSRAAKLAPAMRGSFFRGCSGEAAHGSSSHINGAAHYIESHCDFSDSQTLCFFMRAGLNSVLTRRSSSVIPTGCSRNIVNPAGNSSVL